LIIPHRRERDVERTKFSAKLPMTRAVEAIVIVSPTADTAAAIPIRKDKKY
jgi:hypothetical protein